MAMNLPPDSSELVSQVLTHFAREIAVDELTWILSEEPFAPASPESRQRAEKIVARLEADDKLFDWLSATTPKPCPECGR